MDFFKIHTKARHHDALLRLSDREFRWWFNLCCFVAERGLDNGLMPEPEGDYLIATGAGSVEDLMIFLRKLAALGLVQYWCYREHGLIGVEILNDGPGGFIEFAVGVNRPPKSVWKAIRAEVLKRGKYQCAYLRGVGREVALRPLLSDQPRRLERTGQPAPGLRAVQRLQGGEDLG